MADSEVVWMYLKHWLWGADGVLLGRPFVTAVYGGAAEGVQCYIDKIGGELEDTMRMCGANTISDISRDMIFRA